MNSAAHDHPTGQTLTGSGDLPEGFVEEFVRGVREFKPFVADEMVEAGTSQIQASNFHAALMENMTAEHPELSARIFGDLAAASMVILEVKKAGIDLSETTTKRGFQRAIRSREFKRYLKAEAKAARAELKEIAEREKARQQEEEAISKERMGLEQAIRECNIREYNERIAARAIQRAELERELEFAINERPAILAKELEEARAELARIEGKRP